MAHIVNIAQPYIRVILSVAILLYSYSYSISQVEIDTAAQTVDTSTIIKTEVSPIEENPFESDVELPNFETEQDSLDYFSNLQEQQDSIARSNGNLDKINDGNQEEEKNDKSKDKTKTKEDDGYGIFSMFQGNPGRAGLYSLVVPGLGQAYNKRWWKIPLVIAAEATTIYILQDRISKWNFWDDEYRSIIDGNPPSNPNFNVTSADRERTSARSNKDNAWIALIAVHIIVAADAFVDRHLIEFDVDDDLSIKASPIAPYPGLNLVMTF